MFYSTYRPKTIAELDNSTVKEVINLLLSSKNIPHAFIFIGQKGTGKTSTARIVAKSLNCLKNHFAGRGSSVEPCNTCPSCLAIDASSSPDITELDAASNRGIEDIKKIIMEASFLPLSARKRIFIIDEAHMITNEGFNALLKTLEEPPAQAVFILATTNVEKVPKTIVSRCSIVNFGIAKKEDLIKMLNRIAASEKISVSKETIELISVNADHSFRDAAKLLEELSVQKRLNYKDANSYLGLVKQDFLNILFTEDLTQALEWIQFFEKQGGSIKNLLTELLNELHELLLTPTGKVPPRTIARLMKLLNEAYSSTRYAPLESIPLEIAVVEFYNS